MVIDDPTVSKQDRLSALKDLATTVGHASPTPGQVNNHIHTIYSFSPYTPSAAAFRSRKAGLETAGSVDHELDCGGIGDEGSLRRGRDWVRYRL